jgi:hypothetical protein
MSTVNWKRALFLGLLGAGLVILILACTARVHAEEARLEPVPCRAAEAFDIWLASVSNEKAAKVSPDLIMDVARYQGQLTALCASQPTDEQLKDGSAAPWLRRADQLVFFMNGAVTSSLSRPMTARARQYVHGISFWILTLEGALMDSRAQAYAVVRVDTKEVVRTVEVPARCPEAAPPPRNPCADALRQGASRWSGQLYKWTSWYQGSGADWTLADSSKSELADIARGSGDPAPYIVGWLAQWRDIRRRHSTSFLGSGPMTQIAADMRTQLSYCGMPQPDFDR